MSEASLPTGVVTFLLSDIEGSTRLWETAPDTMRQALARHDALFERIVADHGGIVVKSRGEGDAMFCVFERATQATQAAAALQVALHDELWPTPAPIRVRLALHTGEVAPRDGDYYGGVVNRGARLRALGHGGQILLSAAAQELVRDHLPPGLTLVDLAEHRLRDLARPERVYQLNVPGAPSQFPALKSLDATPNNLPAQLTSFVGREVEVAVIRHQLTETRLLTLTGPGGVGKTRLALQVAAEQLDAYTDGAWFVELAAVTDPSMVARTVAATLGLREEGSTPILATTLAYLSTKRLLLILDNCEHLIDAGARFVDAALRQCGGLTVLATSREPLGISGERVFQTPSLALPAIGPTNDSAALERLTTFEAVRLFIDRAVATQPTFQVTNANAPAVAELCARLDGIPLAIELAAARVRLLSVEQIATRLDDRFRLLTGGSRAALPRQQTLRALVDWSHDLLAEPEKVLFRRLACFAGGFTLEAVEGICADAQLEAFEALDHLGHLVDKSLVVRADAPTGEPRYRLLETLREYARQRLAESVDAAATLERHARYFLALARQAAAELSGPARARWLDRLELVRDNLRAALDWTINQGDAEAACEFAGALQAFWGSRNSLGEANDCLDRVLAIDPHIRTVARATALAAASQVAYWRHEPDRAAALAEAAVDLAQSDDTVGCHCPGPLADGLRILGGLALQRGDRAEAERQFNAALDLSRAHHLESAIAAALVNLGLLALDRRDFATAKRHLAESVKLSRGRGDAMGLAAALLHLGWLAHLEGRDADAVVYLEECLTIYRDDGNQLRAASALGFLATARISQGDFDAATQAFAEQLRDLTDLGLPRRLPATRWHLGWLAYHRRDVTTARDQLEAALEQAEAMGEGVVVALAAHSLARLAADAGDFRQASELYRRSFARVDADHDREGYAWTALGAADIAAAPSGQGGQSASALGWQLFGAACHLIESAGHTRSGVNRVEFASHRAAVETRLHTATRDSGLTSTEVADQLAVGREWSLDTLVDQIRRVLGAATDTNSPHSPTPTAAAPS